MKHRAGATFIRTVLKISGSKVVSVEPLPLINIKPRMTTHMPIANMIKLTLSNAKFLLSIFKFIRLPQKHGAPEALRFSYY